MATEPLADRTAAPHRAWVALIAALLFTLTACARGATEPPGDTGSVTPVKFLLNRPPSVFHAPWYMAQEQGYYEDEDLEVLIQPAPEDGSSITTLTSVASGEMDMGISDVTSMVLAREQDPDLPVTIVSTHERGARFIIVSLKSGANITQPENLKGVTVHAPLATSVDDLLQAWATEQGIGPLKFEDVAISVFSQFLVSGRIPVTISAVDTIFALQALAEGEGEEVVSLAPKDFGLDDFYGGVMVVNDDFAAEHPEAVSGFVAATLRGFEYTNDNIESSAEAMYEMFPLIAAETGSQALRAILDLATGDGEVEVGFIDPEVMATTITFLQSGLGLEQDLPPDDFYTTEFLPSDV